MISNKDFWVIVPAHNEADSIGSVLDNIKKYANNIIVVDDGSTDSTAEIAEKSGAICLKHMINLGKGAAVKTGCDFAVEKGAEYLILIDADAQHDPKEIPNFLAALENNDIVLGYRKLNKNMPFIFRFGNSFINSVTSFLYRISIKDSQCGYRAMTSSAYQKLRWDADDYFMESEMISKLRKTKLRYAQLPIQTVYADKYKGTTIFDGIKIVFKLISWRLFK